jgi:hypothetical protein
MAKVRPFYGIVGFIGSGKNAYAEVLLGDTPGQMHSFASALKDGIAAIFGFPRDMIEGKSPESREWREQPDEYWSRVFDRPMTPRRILQEAGTNAFRAWFPDIWIAASGRRATGPGTHVFTDARFKNEMKWIRDQQGLVVWVHRPSTSLHSADARDRAMVESLISGTVSLATVQPMFVSDIHTSETSFLSEGQSLIDVVVMNDGDGIDYAAVIRHVEALRSSGDLESTFPFRQTTLYVMKRGDYFQWKWHDCNGHHRRYYDKINMLIEEGFDRADAETNY